ncbi:MAG TPA: peptidoglycan-associated lipoprotein Pal [bacterium]|nr:peptidoglycan-associated lipoprotein Pal [Candidatus Omnitrophota bacterium]HOJ60131.1 peptidoglycan-associated lipoprotein Pal [bacterium]HOL96377.1 peptidoglycan-associated lipoprotein Pal [bacterium]HPP02017.1 peptidoglycan-associated lipoprotein Pal [bacterium]HXK92924.1 peptidoglycan-associated lipoprotein Pal [bacterium]
MKGATFLVVCASFCLFGLLAVTNTGSAVLNEGPTGIWSCWPQTRYIKADMAVVTHPDIFKWKFAQRGEKTVEKPTTPPETPPTTPDLTREPEKGVPKPLPEKVVYFDYDKALLKPEGKAAIQRNVQFLKENPKYTVLIEGHCDERGTPEYNIALGERRAEAVKSYMMELGIAGERITTKSWGEERPVDPGHTEAAWRLNRRAEMFYYE